MSKNNSELNLLFCEKPDGYIKISELEYRIFLEMRGRVIAVLAYLKAGKYPDADIIRDILGGYEIWYMSDLDQKQEQ